MQKAGFCYREFSRKVWMFWPGDLSANRSDTAVILQDLLPELGRVPWVWTLGGCFPALLDGRLQTGEKRLARSAAVQMSFQFITHRVIKLLVQIVGEFGEHRLAATRPRLRGSSGDRRDGLHASAASLHFHKFLADKQPCPVQTNA